MNKVLLISVSLVLGILLLFVLAWHFYFSRSSSSTVLNFRSIFTPQDQLKSQNGRINILLLGIAGGKHDGADLTDTIMVASYDKALHKTSLISIPRDLWVEKYHSKANALYETGLNEDTGFSVAENQIGEIVGLNIPYAVRVDFSGFTKAVDLIGGIDVGVENSFDEYFYPIVGKENDMCGYQETERDVSADEAVKLGVQPGKLKMLIDKDGKIATAAAAPGQGIAYNDDSVFQYFPCRFEHLHFVSGLTHMDGETALKFVRSRHGDHGEGSDFARSKRQQLVLQAFKQKVLSANTLTDLPKIVELLKTLGSSVDTDIPASQYLEFLKLVKQSGSLINIVIDNTGKNPLLITPPLGLYGGAWVVVPKTGNYDQIHQFIQNKLTGVIEATGSGKGE